LSSEPESSPQRVAGSTGGEATGVQPKTASDAGGAPRRGLGRGLEVLIGGQPVPSELLEIPVDAIHPNPRQPRRRFEPEAASGLAESVRRQGVIQPLLVRPRGIGGYEIVAGERRWRAAREAGRETVPAVVRTADDRETLLLGLVENVAREQLTPIEEARAYAVLIDEFSLSLGEVAERVGRSKPSVSNRIRLLELPDDVLGMVERGQLTEGHARAVLAVPDHEGRRRLAREIVRRGLSVRAAEQRAKWAGARQRPRVRSSPVDPALAERVRSAVVQLTGRHARVVPERVELPFGDEHDLAELAEALENAVERMGDPDLERPR
jgi:ParB family chromosome partitioning protein